VMGWLRACRGAFAEGLEVLYGTNTFFVESLALFDALFCPVPCRARQLLILPQRLASITSLELRWEVLLFGRLGHQQGDPWTHLYADEGRAQVATHLRYLGEAFSGVRMLVLSFGDFYNDYSVRPALVLGEIDRVLLRPIADAVARLPQAQEQPVIVELPSNVFRDVHGDCAPGLGLEAEKRGEEWGEGKGVWLRYPLPSSSAVQGEGDGPGQDLFYYIKEGAESDLGWDYNDNPRSLSYRRNHPQCGG